MDYVKRANELCYGKKQRRRRSIWFKLTAVLLILGALSGVLLWHFAANVLPAIFSLSEARIRVLSTRALNSAAQAVINHGHEYNDIVHVVTDANGEIQMLNLRAAAVNEILRELAIFGQANIEQLREQQIEVPLGAFTGSVVLAGLGPHVRITLLPVGVVEAELISTFEDAGINQTRHRIYVNMVASVTIVLPFVDEAVVTKTPVLLTETIIVGRVPEFFFNTAGGIGTGGGGLLNLLP